MHKARFWKSRWWRSSARPISEQTIYTWRKLFGGFQANDIRRLKQLETDNARLKEAVCRA